MTAYFLFILFLLIIILILITKNKVIVAKNKQLEEMVRLERAGFRRLITYERKASRFKHDLRNQMLGIEYLLKAGKTDAGIDHLTELVHNFHALEYDFTSAGTIWNLLIECKISEYRAEDIRIARQINLQNIGSIDEVDFCIILGNLLDNAFQSVVTAQDKKIRIVLIQDKGFLYIEINNTCTRANSAKPVLNIGDRVEHGFGLQNVQEIVKRYGGKMEIEKLHNLFNVRIIIPNMII